MTPEQLDLIASSAAAATRDRRGFGASVYGRLFELAPQGRTLFPDDIDEQSDKLVDELAFLTRAATDLDSFVDRARDLGRRHDGYGVEESHYALVRQALLDALAGACGDEWTEQHVAAWGVLYNLIAETMLDGANEALFAR